MHAQHFEVKWGNYSKKPPIPKGILTSYPISPPTHPPTHPPHPEMSLSLGESLRTRFTGIPPNVLSPTLFPSGCRITLAESQRILQETDIRPAHHHHTDMAMSCFCGWRIAPWRWHYGTPGLCAISRLYHLVKWTQDTCRLTFPTPQQFSRKASHALNPVHYIFCLAGMQGGQRNRKYRKEITKCS